MPDNLTIKNCFRSHNCGELRKEDDKQKVRLSGWVHSIRDHGGVIFLMLRDQHGLTQIVANPEISQQTFSLANTIRAEWVITVDGEVSLRTEETINPKINTGMIDVVAHEIKVIQQSKTPPFEIDKDSPVKDDAIRYRYLHLRREDIKNKIILRSKLTKYIRDFLYAKGFLEIETPILTKATPEGARDFLVPSRVFPGEFYALPQSPQQYKQLLMVAGFDKYFQIARALRDEDSRSDRQPEHTQIDMEMSFVQPEDVIQLLEELFVGICKNLAPSKKLMFTPFKHISFHDAYSMYGSDKPDLRFGLKFNEIKHIFKDTSFKIFQKVANDKDGHIKAIKLEKMQDKMSRKEIDELTEIAKTCGMAGIVSLQKTDQGYRSSAGSAISDNEISAIMDTVSAEKGDVVFVGSGFKRLFLEQLSLFRSALANRYKLIDPDLLAFAFVVDFPLFEYNENEKRLDPLHHMFVLPKTDQIHLLDSQPEKIISTQYDVVCNGYEICSGSRRIHDSKMQRKVMQLIGLSDAEIDKKFSHILNAFEYGAPPHGGAAPGLERILMVLLGTSSIRDCIPFPKTQRGQDLMMDSPSSADQSQLKELGLKIDWENISEERRNILEKKGEAHHG